MKKEYILRIDEELYEELKKYADEDERSVNAQITFIIKKFIEEKKKKKKGSN